MTTTPAATLRELSSERPLHVLPFVNRHRWVPVPEDYGLVPIGDRTTVLPVGGS